MCTWFGKPRVRLADKYNGRDGPHAHLSRWVQAGGKQPVWMHMNFVLGNTVNKHVLGGGECVNISSSCNDKVWREQSHRSI